MRYALCSHELTNILIVTSGCSVRDLGHEGVLNESSEEFCHFSSIHSSTSTCKLVKLGLHLSERASLQGPPVSINKLVAEACNVWDSLRQGLHVIVNITLIEDVGSAGCDVDVFLELVKGEAVVITSGRAFLWQTLVVLAVIWDVDYQLTPQDQELVVALHAVSVFISSVFLHVQKHLLEEGLFFQ